MKHIIVGTAGHIDHGKTSLIKALTGIDTDRLKEEKLRGITIELGFAYYTLPDKTVLGIIDVPGHEKFIKHMVAGAYGIDIVILVIAADEGVRQQTKEHMDILKFLKIKHGIPVLTKIDIVSDDWLELVKDDVKSFLKGTFLEDEEIIPLSSKTGEGIPKLIGRLQRIVEKIEEKNSKGPLRLPIDRVFTMKGFGTVISGTIISGKISVGDTVIIEPKGIMAKVRGIQVHNSKVSESVAGVRTAVNFQGIEKELIERGYVITRPSEFKVTSKIDVSMNYLSSMEKKLKNKSNIRFHHGTSEILGKIFILDKDEISPGESAFCQINLEKPTILAPYDPFILRSISPVGTIGGGIILDTMADKHKKYEQSVISQLNLMLNGENEEVLELRIRKIKAKGITEKELICISNIEEDKFKNLLISLKERKKIIYYEDGKRLVHAEIFNILIDKIISIIKSFHEEFPLKNGISKEEIRKKIDLEIDEKLYLYILEFLRKERKIVIDGDKIKLYTFQVTLNNEEAELKDKIVKLYYESFFTPPLTQESAEKLGIDENKLKPILNFLIQENILIKVKENLIFHKEAIQRAKDLLVDFLKKNKEMTPSNFKEITNTSRKFAIPLLEYFDEQKITIRVGEKRVLRG